jgi:hypothetical protein
MHTATKLAAFAAVLAAVFVLAFGVGAAVGPLDSSDDPPATTTTTSHAGHG